MTTTLTNCAFEDDLQAFALRVAEDGLCVSRTFMRFDRNYALDHLRLAHESSDDALRELSVRLFRHFEFPHPSKAFAQTLP